MTDTATDTITETPTGTSTEAVDLPRAAMPLSTDVGHPGSGKANVGRHHMLNLATVKPAAGHEHDD